MTHDVPVAIGRSVNGYLVRSIPIVVTWDWDIIRKSPGIGSLIFDVPVSIGGTVDGYIAGAVAIVVAGDG